MEKNTIDSKPEHSAEISTKVSENSGRDVNANRTEYFSDLMEDCLLPILTQLNTFELIAVSQINNYLNGICFMLINKRPRDFYTTTLIDRKILDFHTISKSRGNRTLTFNETALLFKCVGNYVNTIILNNDSFETFSMVPGQCKSLQLDYILELLNVYCADGNLEHIYINNFYLVKNAGKYKNIWKNLKTLSLINYSMDECEIEAILKQATQLHTLELELVYLTRSYPDYIEGFEIEEITGACMFQLSQTVQYLTLRNSRGLQLYNLMKIFELNSQIISFTYTSFHEDAFGPIVYGQIAHRLKNLRYLRLGEIGKNADNIGHRFKSILLHQNMSSLANLNNLTKFVFDGNGLNVTNLLCKLAQNNTLTELTIRNCCINVKSNSIGDDNLSSPFTNLKLLRLYFVSKEDLADDFFTGLAHIFQASNLNDLYVEHIDFRDDESSHLYLTQFEIGLENFLKTVKNLKRIMFKIPVLRISVKNYLHLSRVLEGMNRPNEMQVGLPIYLLRRNITMELSQYMNLLLRNNQRETIVFKLYFACSDYFL